MPSLFTGISCDFENEKGAQRVQACSSAAATARGAAPLIGCSCRAAVCPANPSSSAPPLHAVKQSIHHFIRSGPFTSSAARTAASPAVPLSWRHWSHALAPLGLGGSPARPDCRPSSQPNTAPLWPWLSQHAAGGVFIPCAVLSPLLSWQAWRYLSAERAPRPPRLRPPHRRLLLRARCRRA